MNKGTSYMNAITKLIVNTSLLACLVAISTSNSALAGDSGFGVFGSPAGTTGNATSPTVQDYQQSDTARSGAGVGQSFKTGNQGYSDANNPLGQLPEARTGLVAPASVNNAPIPSGKFNLGMKGDGGSQPYTGPYAGSGSQSGQSGATSSLPAVSTGSVDLSITDK